MKTIEENGAGKNDLYLQTALKAGQIALSNGSETFRCNTIMQNILSRSGETDYDSSVVSKSIFARLGQKVGMNTIRRRGTDLNKFCLVNDVSNELSSGTITIDEAIVRLDNIERTKLYGLLIRMFAYMFMMASMAILISGSLFDSISAALFGLVMGLLDFGFYRIEMHSFAVILIKSLVMMICASLAAFFFKGKVNIEIIAVASILPLLPGLAMTNAVRETLQGDYVSGTSRLMEAVVRAGALSLGVIIGLLGMNLIPAISESMYYCANAPVSSGTLKYVVCLIAAFFFALGFSIVFEVPIRLALIGSVIGGLGKLCFFLLVDQNISNIVSTLLATVIIAILGRICGEIMKKPTIPFMIGGIMTLAPGSALYSSIFYFVVHQYREGAVKLMDTFLTAGAIALGIFLVDTVYQLICKARKKK